MGYIVLWIECLASLLVSMAFLLAWVGRWHRRWLRHAIWATVWYWPVVCLAIFTALCWAMMQQRAAWASKLTWGMFALLAAFIIGSFWLRFRGLRPTEEGPMPTVAGNWSRKKLAVAWAISLMLTLLTCWNMDLAARQQLENLRIEAGNIAVSISPPSISDHANAAFVYERAMEGFFPLPEAEQDLVDQWCSTDLIEAKLEDGPVVDPTSPELRAIVQKYSPRLALLHKAAAMPECCFEADGSKVSGNSSKLARFLQKILLLIRLDATVKIADGNVNGAIEDINTLFGMANHLGSVPINYFGSEMAQSAALLTIQQLVSSNKASADALKMLRMDEGVSSQIRFEREWRMEEAAQLLTFYRVALGDLSITKVAPIAYAIPRGQKHFAPPPENVTNAQVVFDFLFSSFYRLFILPNELANYRQWRQDAQGIISKPYYETQAKWEELEKQRLRIVGPVSNFTPTISTKRVAEMEARKQTTRLGLAANAFRSKNGRYPEKLNDLVPEFIPWLPADPCDGKPMRMKRTDNGLVIYSVGPDGKDNSGTPFSWKHTPRETDIVFELSDTKP